MHSGKNIGNGAIAGLFAGIIFIFFLLLKGMHESFADIIGVYNVLNGLIIHFIISLIAGVIFALIFGWVTLSWLAAMIWGILFGILMWAIGPMTLLPWLNNSPTQWHLATIEAHMQLLLGYIIYGFVLGLSYCFLKKGKLHKLKIPGKSER